MTKIDRPEVDPFTIQEAETLVLGIHSEWGEAVGNFDEFRFFTGLRQSEEIGLRIAQCNLTKGTITIRETIVLGKDKDRPKTNEARTVELCARALAVLKRQFALREVYARAGKIAHDFVFFQDDGRPIRSLNYVYKRWRYSVDALKLRYREPYTARHSSVSWNLMIGKNLMWCSLQHGHSVQVMLATYGRWISGSTDADVALIKASMGAGATAESLWPTPVRPP